MCNNWSKCRTFDASRLLKARLVAASCVACLGTYQERQLLVFSINVHMLEVLNWRCFCRLLASFWTTLPAAVDVPCGYRPAAICTTTQNVTCATWAAAASMSSTTAKYGSFQCFLISCIVPSVRCWSCWEVFLCMRKLSAHTYLSAMLRRMLSCCLQALDRGNKALGLSKDLKEGVLFL